MQPARGRLKPFHACHASGVSVPEGTADALGNDNTGGFRYTVGMKLTETLPLASHIGHVKNGVVVLDAHISLAEGQAVRVEPLTNADLSVDRANRVRQLRQLFDQWTEEDGQLSDEEADRLHAALRQNQRLSFRPANI
jgi:hypothetical protein